MKKFFLLMTAMILAVGAFAAERVIYCKVAQSWWKADGAAVAAYAWSGEGDETVTNAKWPGLRMNPVEGQTDVWSTNFDLGAYEKIIFVRVNGEGDIQDWGAKTADLTIPADENDLYVITSETAVWDGPVAGKWTQLASGGDPDPDPEPEVLYYIAGTMTDWATNKIAATSVRTTLELKAGDHKLKVITLEDEWKGYKDLSDVPKGVTTDDDGNICFTLAEDGNVIVSYSKDAFVIDGRFYVKLDDPDPDPAKFYITGDSALIVDLGHDKEKAWKPDAIKVPGEAAVLRLKADQDYQLKITENGQWESAKGFEDLTRKPEGVSGDKDGNICFKLTEAADVKVTYIQGEGAAFLVESEKFYVAPEEKPKMEIAGAWEVDEDKQWVRNEMKLSADEKTASFEVELVNGRYEFKLIKDGKWIAKANDGEAYGLHREWVGVAGLTYVTENLAVEADVDGKYIFTWTFANDSIGIDFPEKGDEPETVKFYITGDSALVVDAGLDKEKAWKADAIKSTEDSYELSLKGDQDYQLKIVVGENWLGYDALTAKAEGLVDGENHNIGFKLKEAGKVKVTYALGGSGSVEFKLEGNFYVEPVVEDAKFYITGDAALVGKELAWNPKAIAVIEDSYTFENLAAGEYKMKITLDGTWATAKGFADLTNPHENLKGDADGNIVFYLASADKVTVSYTEDAFRLEGNFAVKTVDEDVKYYIAGTMTDWADNKIAVKDVRYQLKLEAGDHKLKLITVGGDWLGYDALSDKPEGVTTDGDGNICFTLKEAGIVDISYDGKIFVIGGNFYVKPVEPEENIVVYVVNKLKWEKVMAYIWRVEGDKAIPYAEWPGIEMSIPKQAPALAGVVAEEDQVFVVEFPKEFDQIIFNNGAGEQTVDLSLDEEKPYFVLSEEKDGEGHYTGEWQQSVPGGDPDPEPEMNYYIAGSMTDWQVSEAYKLAANPEAEGEFLGEFTFAAGDEFKVVYSDGATVTDNHWFPQGMENNYKITEDGQYTVYFRPAGGMEGWHEGMILAVKGEGPEPEQRLADGYYLIGSKTDWSVEKLTADLLFASNEGQEGEFVLTTTLEIEQAIKVVKVEKDVIVTWFPDGEGNEYKVDADHAGEKTIYFRPAGNAEWADFGGFIWIDPNPNEAIDNIADGVKAVKVLRDGTIYILRNGKTFDVTGKLVK